MHRPSSHISQLPSLISLTSSVHFFSTSHKSPTPSLRSSDCPSVPSHVPHLSFRLILHLFLHLSLYLSFPYLSFPYLSLPICPSTALPSIPLCVPLLSVPPLSVPPYAIFYNTFHLLLHLPLHLYCNMFFHLSLYLSLHLSLHLSISVFPSFYFQFKFYLIFFYSPLVNVTQELSLNYSSSSSFTVSLPNSLPLVLLHSSVFSGYVHPSLDEFTISSIVQYAENISRYLVTDLNIISIYQTLSGHTLEPDCGLWLEGSFYSFVVVRLTVAVIGHTKYMK